MKFLALNHPLRLVLVTNHTTVLQIHSQGVGTVSFAFLYPLPHLELAEHSSPTTVHNKSRYLIQLLIIPQLVSYVLVRPSENQLHEWISLQLQSQANSFYKLLHFHSSKLSFTISHLRISEIKNFIFAYIPRGCRDNIF